MKETTRIGIDLAKSIFHLVAMDGRGKVLWRRKLVRRELLAALAKLKPAVIGLEACASAHHWAREIAKLGHEVKLINPSFVVPYRKGGKNDFNDAEAVGEALSRPTMRFVEVKSLAQQDLQSLHRARRLVLSQRNRVANHLRGLLAEYGIVIPRGIVRLRREVAGLPDDPERLSGAMGEVVSGSLELLTVLERRLKALDLRLQRACRGDERCLRLAQINGVGPLTATATVAKVGNARQFRRGRDLSAYLGLVPGQRSTGGRTVLLSITKRGDRYLRTLLIHGARAALRVAERRTDPTSRWVNAVRLRRGPNVAAVALANKNCRRIWKLLTSGENFNPQPPRPTAELASAAHRSASQKTAGPRGARRLRLDSETIDFSAALRAQ